MRLAVKKLVQKLVVQKRRFGVQNIYQLSKIKLQSKLSRFFWIIWYAYSRFLICGISKTKLMLKLEQFLYQHPPDDANISMSMQHHKTRTSNTENYLEFHKPPTHTIIPFNFLKAKSFRNLFNHIWIKSLKSKIICVSQECNLFVTDTALRFTRCWLLWYLIKPLISIIIFLD